MAEAVLLIQYATPPGKGRRGDVIVVADRNHEWGRREQPPYFARVQVAGVSVEDAQAIFADKRCRISPRELDKHPMGFGGKIKVTDAELASMLRRDRG